MAISQPRAPESGHRPSPAWRPGPAALAATFDHQRRIDPFGHRVHAWLGALACACVAGPTTAVELGALPVVAAFLIRFHRHWRTLPLYFLQPLMLVALAWIALSIASRLWTMGPHNAWLDQFGTARFLILAAALWPVADRRTLLLAGLALGFALGQASQACHALGLWTGTDWLTWNRLPGRNSGWWDPVVGGTVLTAALGIHLPAALWGRGRWRALGAAGTILTLAGVLATGTRGAWLACAALVGLGLLAAIVRVRPLKKLAQRLAILALLATLIGAALWATLGDQLRARYDAGHAEVTAALQEQNFDTDTGARLLMAWWALEALADRPLTGAGVGGYEQWTRRHTAAQGIEPTARRHHAHAHNALLHAGATLGVPGLALALAFVALALHGALSRNPGDGPPGYADAPAFALAGLVLVSPFDAVHINSQTAALLCLLTVFAVRRRPPPALSAGETT
jgi:O-antigen ligase